MGSIIKSGEVADDAEGDAGLHQGNSEETCFPVIKGCESVITSIAEVTVRQVVGNKGLSKREVSRIRYYVLYEVVNDSDRDPSYVPCNESESDDCTWDSGVDAFVTEGRWQKPVCLLRESY